MGNSDLGEPSKKNRNCNSDGERPFKKARYVWQLKGKYHLKNNTSKPTTTSNHSDPIDKSFINSSDSDSDAENININNNNGLVSNNNIICNEKCCIDDLLIHSNALLENEDSDQEPSTNNIEKSISDDIPVTLVKPNSKNQDEYLQKWQARQVAKSFVDNTINSILEHWKIAPFDATDFVENCENGEQVEDEGILMAIQSHGLQSGLRYSAPNSQYQISSGEASRYQCQTHRTSRSESSASLNNEHIAASTLDNLENIQTERLNNENSTANNDTVQMEDPMDFLNAAVSVAIQKKGLSSYNYG